MKTQLPIGSKFNYEYVELEVKEGHCHECYFEHNFDCIGYTRNCNKFFRDDQTFVNYQLVIKE